MQSIIYYYILQKCLDKDPARRWTCEKLLNHPFFKVHNFKIPPLDDMNGRRVSRTPLSRNLETNSCISGLQQQGSSGNYSLPQLGGGSHMGSPDGRFATTNHGAMNNNNRRENFFPTI